MKILQLIRHGHSLHNELFHKIGVQAFRVPETIDAPLTHYGHTQSIELGNSWPKKQEIELKLIEAKEKKEAEDNKVIMIREKRIRDRIEIRKLKENEISHHY